jgi:prophage regulatory protein
MKVLTYPALRERKGIPYTRAHLWRLEREGRFPRRVAIGENRIAWIESEIDAWLAEKAAQRQGVA